MRHDDAVRATRLTWTLLDEPHCALEQAFPHSEHLRSRARTALLPLIEQQQVAVRVRIPPRVLTRELPGVEIATHRRQRDHRMLQGMEATSVNRVAGLGDGLQYASGQIHPHCLAGILDGRQREVDLVDDVVVLLRLLPKTVHPPMHRHRAAPHHRRPMSFGDLAIEFGSSRLAAAGEHKLRVLAALRVVVQVPGILRDDPRDACRHIQLLNEVCGLLIQVQSPGVDAHVGHLLV
mmetsp:Transcript_69881/g.202778  ORF Transcript_69881/g.202778 Transcript_69881/m.202778 type:complete len:235 (-) Transcript_69881:414-1118(-)